MPKCSVAGLTSLPQTNLPCTASPVPLTVVIITWLDKESGATYRFPPIRIRVLKRRAPTVWTPFVLRGSFFNMPPLTKPLFVQHETVPGT